MSDPNTRTSVAPQSPQPLDYYNPVAAPRRSRWRWAYYAVLSLSVMALLVSILLPACGQVRPGAKLIYCQSNLRQVYLAMFTYVERNGGQYPDGPADLLPILGSSNALACREANDTPAPGPTTQALRQQLASGGHLSYLYLAKGLTTKASADTVLGLDASPCHLDGTTVNILFGDGHVEPRPRAQWMAILTQLASGVRPIRDPALPPATQPSTASHR